MYDYDLLVCGGGSAGFATAVTAAKKGLSVCLVEMLGELGGVLTAGNREIPLCELEVELKSGSETAAIAWAEHFAARFGLQPEQNRKFRRALMLSKGEYHG